MRSFSQLRNEFADVDTFYLGVGGANMNVSPARRSRSRAGTTAVAPNTAMVEDMANKQQQRRARSKSRPRVLYAPENEIVRSNGKEVGHV